MKTLFVFIILFSITTTYAEESNCNLQEKDQWSSMAQAVVDQDPVAELGGECLYSENYAQASIDLSNESIEMPPACSKFMIIFADKKEVASYNWAYSSIIEVMKNRGGAAAERAARIETVLVRYNEQFNEYFLKINEFYQVCKRVYSVPSTATVMDLQTWSMSGRTYLNSISSSRAAVWNKDRIKSTLDESFESVKSALDK